MPHPHIDVGLYVPAQPPLRDLKRLILAARTMRLDSVMIWDHIQDFAPRALWDTDLSWVTAQLSSPHQWYDYRTIMGYLGTRVGRLRLGVGVTEAIRQHPVSIAQSAITLSHITKRAPILGIGAGERMNTEPYGLPLDHPVGRLDEALQIIRQCFTSDGPFNFDGRHFTLKDAVMDLTPPPGRIPEIWVAAHGPRMLELTGTYADGWYPNLFFPDEYATKLEVICQAARSAGRDPNAITPSNQISLFVAATEQEARKMAESRVARYITLAMPAAAWNALGAQHPFGDTFRGWVDILPESYPRELLEDAMQHVPLDVTTGLFPTGTPDQIIARLRQFGDAGMRHTTLILGSALISQRAALYSLRALWHIKRALS